ncbi:protein of unknown function [Micropruina glycogenica]|uniref:Uncharacterized protein n=1 Tax=Micropruina glycogenica TaxID=75385 RepID=A0A2N9JHI0_9ACTN|nr:protein of unknown function [Micropruina glycogenica]
MTRSYRRPKQPGDPNNRAAPSSQATRSTPRPVVPATRHPRHPGERRDLTAVTLTARRRCRKPEQSARSWM